MRTKTYILTVSKNFMKEHPRAGEPTGFKEKILAGQKIHTIRENYAYWNEVVTAVNSGAAVLSVREWAGKPYNSPQIEITQLQKLGIQKITFGLYKIDIDLTHRTGHKDCMLAIATNDGLSAEDFKNWFSKLPFTGAIIHFTDFRY